jgi:hypothetical protein
MTLLPPGQQRLNKMAVQTRALIRKRYAAMAMET